MADLNKQICKYGEYCYQKNSLHLSKYSHPEKCTEEATLNTAKNENKRQLRSRSMTPQENPQAASKIRKKSKSPARRSSSKGHCGSNENLSNDASPREMLSPPAPRNMKSDHKTSLADGPSPEQDIDFINNCFDTENRYSQRAEYKEMLQDPKVFIKQKFLVEMPKDFFLFWQFCEEQVGDSGPKPETLFNKFGMILEGPFDVLSGKFANANMLEPGDYLRHCRYYYDPPEFQTVLKKEKSGIHYGYWRDSPTGNEQTFIARNNLAEGCEIQLVADNIFSGVINFLEKDATLTPFNRSPIKQLIKSLEDFAKKNSLKVSDNFKGLLKSRNSRVVTQTFHRAGLVVPVEGDIGYRCLNESDANIKKILSLLDGTTGDEAIVKIVIEKLQPLITAANIAVDEGDFGNAIELGVAIFCYGSADLHRVLLRLLVNGYSMVKRPQFIAIVKAHLEQRRRGNNISIFHN